MQRWITLATLLALVLPAPAQDESTATETPPNELTRLLARVPEDAHLLVIVPRLDELTAAVNTFGQAAQVEGLAGFAATELLRERVGAGSRGIDRHGPLVIASSTQRGEALLLARCDRSGLKNAAAQPETLAGGARLYRFDAEDHLAATVDDVIIFGRSERDLERALAATGATAQRFGKVAAQRLDGHAAAVIIDLPAWRDTIEFQMDMFVQGMFLGMPVKGPDADIAMEIWTGSVEQIKRLLAEARTLVVTADLDAAGARAQAWMEFAPDGKVADYLRRLQRPQRDLLRGLRAGGGAVVFALEWEDPPDAEGPSAALNRSLLNMPRLREKIGAERLASVLEKNEIVNRKAPGTSGALEFGRADEGMVYWGLYLSPRGPQVLADLQSIYSDFPDVMSAWGALPAPMEPAAHESVAGQTAVVYRFGLADAPQPTVEALYGAEPTMYMAAHPAGVAYTLGPRDAARRALRELLEPAGRPLRDDARVRPTLRMLSPNPQMMVLIDVPRMLDSAAALMERVGLRRAEAPEIPSGDTPMVGGAVYLDADAVRAEAAVPVASVRVLEEMRRARQRDEPR
jgi:hypothetical protein